MRDFLENIVHGFRSAFGIEQTPRHDVAIPLLFQAQSGLCEPARSLDAQTQTIIGDGPKPEPIVSAAQTQTFDQVSTQSGLGKRLKDLNPASGMLLPTETDEEPQKNADSEVPYTSTDGKDDRRTVVLTDSLIAQISQVLRASRQLAGLEQSYMNASREARLGRSFLEHAAAMAGDGETEEQREHYAQSLRERESAILRDISLESGLNEELQKWKRSREDSRDGLENTLEQILVANGLYEAPTTDQPYEIPGTEWDADVQDTVSEVTVSVDSANDGFLVDPTAKTAEQARMQYENATKNMLEFQELFGRQAQDNEEEVMRYREALHNGEVDFPESELHELHLEQGRQLTLNVIEAEIVFERALETAKMWGLVMEDEESDVPDRGDDNDLDSGVDPGDLPTAAAKGDYARIEAWVETVIDPPDENVSEPEIDDWDSQSVDVSSTFSMVDSHPSNRRRIDRWRSYCSSYPLPR